MREERRPCFSRLLESRRGEEAEVAAAVGFLVRQSGRREVTRSPSGWCGNRSEQVAMTPGRIRPIGAQIRIASGPGVWRQQ